MTGWSWDPGRVRSALLVTPGERAGETHQSTSYPGVCTRLKKCNRMLQHINVRVNHRCQNSPTSSVEVSHRSWCIHFIPLMWHKGRTSESGTCTYFNLDASFRGFFWQLEQVPERVSWRSHQTEQRSCNNCPKICTCDLISIISLHSKTGQEAPGWRQRWRMVTKSCAQTAPQHSMQLRTKDTFSASSHANCDFQLTTVWWLTWITSSPAWIFLHWSAGDYNGEP